MSCWKAAKSASHATNGYAQPVQKEFLLRKTKHSESEDESEDGATEQEK